MYRYTYYFLIFDLPAWTLHIFSLVPRLHRRRSSESVKAGNEATPYSWHLTVVDSGGGRYFGLGRLGWLRMRAARKDLYMWSGGRLILEPVQ